LGTDGEELGGEWGLGWVRGERQCRGHVGAGARGALEGDAGILSGAGIQRGGGGQQREGLGWRLCQKDPWDIGGGQRQGITRSAGVWGMGYVEMVYISGERTAQRQAGGGERDGSWNGHGHQGTVSHSLRPTGRSRAWGVAAAQWDQMLPCQGGDRHKMPVAGGQGCGVQCGDGGRDGSNTCQWGRGGARLLGMGADDMVNGTDKEKARA